MSETRFNAIAVRDSTSDRLFRSLETLLSFLSRTSPGGYRLRASFLELDEISAPATPPAARARLYLRDNGAGKQQLVIKWDDGVVSVLFTQP